MGKKLLTKAADRLTKRHGLRQTGSNADTVDRGSGINYVEFERHDTDLTFLVRAKEYVYQSKAPFGMEMVNHAQRDGHVLVIYFDDRERFYAYDPSYVFNTGVRTTGRSKRTDSRVWLEVALSDGVLLSEFLSGEPLSGREGRSNPGGTSLGDFL